MWPSQRVQHVLLKRGTPNDEVPGRVSELGWNPRGNLGFTSKIEIRHTRLLNSPTNPNQKQQEESISYITGARESRRVSFTPSALRASSETLYHEKSAATSHLNSKTIISELKGENLANGEVGKIAIQALCNRESVLDVVGGDKCLCNLSANAVSDDIKRIKLLDPETQKDELFKLVIRLAEEREKRNQELIARRAQQKLVAAKPIKAHKIHHIICVAGRTMDGRNIAVGEFPNSFLTISQLMDLRKDPPGFQRFTARSDMGGFRDDEISFTNEGNVLKVSAVRSKSPQQTAKVATEEITLPEGVYADTLRIGRNSDGYLIIQEPWKF